MNPLDWIRIHSGETRTYSYDPAAAAGLLEAAGWTPGAGGVRRRGGAGEPLRLELMTTAGDRTRELVEQVIQSQWRESRGRRAGSGTSRRGSSSAIPWPAASSRGFAMVRVDLVAGSVPARRPALRGDPAPRERLERQQRGGLREPGGGPGSPTPSRVELNASAAGALGGAPVALTPRTCPPSPSTSGANRRIRPSWLVGVRPTGHQFPSTLWCRGMAPRDPGRVTPGE